MKHISLIPKFIQSDELKHPIIRTKEIVSIRLDGRFIFFELKENQVLTWNFAEIEHANEAYKKIKDQLKNNLLLKNEPI